MKAELSILIPTYNNICVDLVNDLHAQAQSVGGLSYEIIVADDGSTLNSAIDANRQINSIDHCQYITRKQNTGRAAIRNCLASVANYDWLLFVDSGANISKSDFIQTYVALMHSNTIVCGGVYFKGDSIHTKGNLRYMYEKSCESNLSAKSRNENKYQSFSTANFIIPKAIMTANPFIEDIHRYGYEDVLFGKRLKDNNIDVVHIDNPVAYHSFNENSVYLKKIEDALCNLAEYKDELKEYSRLLTIAETLNRYKVSVIYNVIFRVMCKKWRNSLCGGNPSLRTFNLYRLGYLLSLL